MISAAIDERGEGFDHTFGTLTIIVTTCAINVVSLALPIATLQIYDRILPGKNSESLRLLVFGVAVALLIEIFLKICRSYVITWRGSAFVHRTSCATIRTQLDSKRADAAEHTVASEIASLSSIKNLKDFHSGLSLVTVLDLLFLPLYISVMAYISHSLVLVPLGLLAAFAIACALSGASVRRKLQEVNERDEERYGFLIDSLLAGLVMKSFALERLLQRRFERLHAYSCAASENLSRTISQSLVHSTLVSHAITGATVTYGAYLAVNAQLTVGALIAVVLLSNRLMNPVQKAVLLWLRYQDYQAAQERVDKLIEPIHEVDKNAKVKPDKVGQIELTRVCYRKSPNSPLLLDQIDLRLERGKALLLDGRAGSGRTTLLKLVAGIYVPNSGTIRVNGVNPGTLPPDQLAKQIGYLSANSKLFRGTIRDNITRFGNTSSAQAMEVAEMLDLTKEFARLPLGIDTVVGTENSTSMTPGLVQMITLLRVLAPKPRVILFDDADSGLDQKHYSAFLKLLGKLKQHTTMIIVSTDQNVRQLADHCTFLSEGQLIHVDEHIQSARYQTRL